MNARLICNLLLAVCLFFSTETFSCRPEDLRKPFSAVWNDPSKRDIALEDLRKCTSDQKSLLNVTKHLIGHEHVLDISETHGKLSANFLFVISDDNIINYLKFLRGLYNISNNGTNGHPMGALFILNSNESFASKIKAIEDMQRIFSYGLSCNSIKEQNEKVLDKISQLNAVLTSAYKKELALKAAKTFHRQLSEKNQGTLKNLEKRIPREIELYEQAGLHVSDIKTMVNSKGIDTLRNEPQPLIDCILQVTQIKLPDISDSVKEIINIINNSFFSSPILDEGITSYFLKFTSQYLKTFLSVIGSSFKVNKNTSQISENMVSISFERIFSREEFKKFVSSSLEKDITIEPPEKSAIILLSLKSNLDQLHSSSYKIDVGSENYNIVSTYLATFFPRTL